MSASKNYAPRTRKTTDLSKATEGHILLLVLQDFLVHVFGLVRIHYEPPYPSEKRHENKTKGVGRHTVARGDRVDTNVPLSPFGSESS